VPAPFIDLYIADGPEPTLTYRSGMVAYQEALIAGQWVGRGWNGSGYTNPAA
jgi:hypothetical protein